MREIFSIIIAVQGTVKHIFSFIEYVLSALSMMNIPIYNGNFLRFLLYKILSSDSDIVEKGKSMRLRFQSTMVAWRSNNCKRVLFYVFQNYLYRIKSGFYCLNSSFVRIFHIISIFVDIHLTLFVHLIPHFFYKLKIICAMNLFNILFYDLFTYFINKFAIDDFLQFKRMKILQLLNDIGYSFWYLWMFLGGFMQQIVIIIYDQDILFQQLFNDFVR